jgi:hypothetical protein
MIRRKITLKITIVPPAGKFNKKEKIIPQITDRIEKITEAIIVILKLIESWRAVSGGRINIAETSIMPAIFIVKTATTAVKRKRRIFSLFVLIPML